jgi:hypothetical protein
MSLNAWQQGSRRQVFVWIGLTITLVVLAIQIIRLGTNPNLLPSPDFAMYWAAGRLNASGENPYDPDLVLPLEKEFDPDQDFVVFMYSPPWALSLAMPFGVLDRGVARVLWLGLHFVVVLVAADSLWRIYGGQDRHRWLAWIMPVSFIPTLYMLRWGQIGGLILLGITGFLYFEKRKRDVLAGAALALTALKPHLVFLVLLAVLLWTLDRRRWGVLLGSGLALLIAALLPLAPNQLVYQQYFNAIATHPPLDWMTPTPGTLLRLLFGMDRHWLQFLPAVPAVLWLLFCWFKGRTKWDWARQMPVLVLVSLFTTWYGAWSFDHVISLVAVIQVAVWVIYRYQFTKTVSAAAIYLSFNMTLWLGVNFAGWNVEVCLVWIAPILLLSYLGLRMIYNPSLPKKLGSDGLSSPPCD